MLDLVGLELVQRVHDGAQRALHVRLEDDAQLLGLAGLDLAVQVLQRRPAVALGPRRLGRLALLDDAARLLLVGHDAQHVTGGGHLAQAEQRRRPTRGRPW